MIETEMALKFMSDYLSETWNQKLQEKCGIDFSQVSMSYYSDPIIPKKRSAEQEEGVKKSKDSSKTENHAIKALSKVNKKGMKKLDSFFGKKSK
jgi:hypothetical protein